MKKTTSGALALIILSTLAVQDVAAQESQDRRRGMRGPAVESIMSMRERLELTDDQISALDQIRAERVRERSELQAEMSEMRSLLQAGQIRQSEMMAFLEERRDAAEDVSEARRAEVESVLNETQIEMLDDLRTRSRAFARGRASARGGRGVRGARGQRSFRGERGNRMDGARFEHHGLRGGFGDF